VVERLELVEVSPRDGLQNEAAQLSVPDKLALIALILQAGLTRLEAGSFVNPAKVPQMAGSDAVFEALRGRTDASFIALALNARGVERALAAGAREINFSIAASDGFAIRNNGADVAGLLAAWPQAAALARAGGARLSLTISTVFGCPFDGEVDPGRVEAIVAQAAAAAPDEIALADTIGVATPKDVRARFRRAAAAAPGVRLRAHFHNTRSTALANAVAAVEEGVRVLDGALGGIGGCPFAPGAAGNAPTEDLAWMFARMGEPTGLDLDAAQRVVEFLREKLGKPTPGMVSRAPKWPG
jgi:hydroxymethylglutaryl-CoA lyase